MTAVDQILTALHEQRSTLARRYPIRRLALFGSWARGDAREDSDVDLLVEVDPSIGIDFVELAEEFERALGRHVDLVSSRAMRSESELNTAACLAIFLRPPSSGAAARSSQLPVNRLSRFLFMSTPENE